MIGARYCWVVQCFQCHACYFDRRRRVGRCLRCRSPAVIVDHEGASCPVSMSPRCRLPEPETPNTRDICATDKAP